MKKSFLITPLILLLVVVIFVLNLKPSLSREDINLSFEVENSSQAEGHSLNITLDIKEKGLKYTEKSFYHVYVFPNENNRFVNIDSINISQEDIHLGSDFRTYNNAIRALENTELPYIDEAENTANPFDGFLYTGHNYPITVKNYYLGIDDMKEKEESYIVFSYYEKKFFKNLSWTKVYPFKF